MSRSDRRSNRWGRHPSKMTRKRVRAILVEDAMAGVATPLQWCVEAYLFLGHGDAQAAEREYLSVRQEIASKGGVMPSAPGS